MIYKFSLATLGLMVGGFMTIAGIIAYFTDYVTINLIGFSYGIPILLGGLAFKITELKPVPVTQPATPEVETLRSTQATQIQKQVFRDVTRYWYGQDAHLDAALKKLGLGPSLKEEPQLRGVHEDSVDGCYSLVLDFESPYIPLETWQEKQAKMETFFGPGIRVMITSPQESMIQVALIAKLAAVAVNS
jgi:Protein of unknown function (DUF2854)